MKNEKKYGKQSLDHARRLVADGWSNADIKAIAVCKDIPIGTLGAMRSRFKSATPPATKTAVATQDATAATEMQREETTQQNPAQLRENMAERAVLITFVKNAALNFHPADALYYLGVAICCNAITDTLQGAGVFVAIIVGGVAVIALQGLKTETEWQRRLKYTLAFAGVEVAAAVSHIAWANEALWKNVRALPLDIWVNKYRNGVGEVVMLYGGSDVETPFKIACGIAVVMFLSGVFTFFISIQGKK